MLKRLFLNTTGIVLLIIWIYIVLSVTIFNRTSQPDATYNLELFWCIKEAWTMKNSDDWFFIVGNTLMFVPFGLIVPLCFERMRKLLYTGVVGFVLASTVELVQLILHRGLFEFDDVFNNMVGLILGYGIYLLLMMIFSPDKVESKTEKIIVLFVWVVTVGFYWYAYYMGQPVFDMLKYELSNIMMTCFEQFIQLIVGGTL